MQIMDGPSSNFTSTPVVGDIIHNETKEPALVSTLPSQCTWQHGKTMYQGMLYMFDNQIDCNVTFNFRSPNGSVDKISAHRLILLCRSEVFESMFSGNFRESCSGTDIDIPDVDLMTFKEMLRYMYSDDVDLNSANIMTLMFLSHKYMLNGLLDKCVKYMEDLIAHDTVVMILNQMLSYNQTYLVHKCVDYISSHMSYDKQCKEFMTLSPEALHLVLSCEDLEFASEMDLFMTCMEWAKVHYDESFPLKQIDGNINIRKMLGRAFYEIRFASMSSSEFQKVAQYFDVLLCEEKLLFFACISCIPFGHQDSLAELRNKGFNMKYRNTQKKRFNRFATVSLKATYKLSGNPETFDFIPYEDIQFCGIEMLRGNVGASHHVNVLLYCKSNDTVMCSFSTTVKSTRSSSHFVSVLIEKSVALKRKVVYKLVTTIRGPKTFYGENCSHNPRSVMVQSDCVKILVRNKNDGNGDMRGRVAGAIFYPASAKKDNK